jgi:hypothetical protein
VSREAASRLMLVCLFVTAAALSATLALLLDWPEGVTWRP